MSRDYTIAQIRELYSLFKDDPDCIRILHKNTRLDEQTLRGMLAQFDLQDMSGALDYSMRSRQNIERYMQ